MLETQCLRLSVVCHHKNGRGCESAIRTFAIASLCPSLVRSQATYQRGLPMSQMDHRAPSHDQRWGDHVPWSLRYNIVAEKGDFHKLMTLLATELHRLFEHEFGYGNPSDFLARLTTESLGRFHTKSGETYANSMYYYFAPKTISEEATARISNDPERMECNRLANGGDREAYKKAFQIDLTTKLARYAAHWRNLIAERLEVLQSIFVLLQVDKKDEVIKSLMRNTRRFAADSGVLLDIRGGPPTLVPIEEPLLQNEVLNRLLPRLEGKFPARAADLMKAYHDLLKGVDTNTVFGNAFKSLEELAREASGIPKLELSERSALEKAFPQLHGTIRETIVKLAAHRGDEGAHGRKGPDEYEIRYLLFCICNVALVLLEYKENCG